MTTTPTPEAIDQAIADTVTSPPSVRQAIDHAVAVQKKAGRLQYFSMPTGRHKTKRVRPGVLEITIPMNTGQEITIELTTETEGDDG